jgi:Predicted hydrolases or acyltransferases (alpha/beta hydrolase superfamily)
MRIINQLFFIAICALSYYQINAQNVKECDCSTIGIDGSWAKENNVSCYTALINMIYNDPDKGTKEIAFIKAKSSENTDLDPILYLHGGPGNATLDVAQKYLSNPFWKKLREKHDIVMLDYPGNGFSGPYLCQDLEEAVAAVYASDLSELEQKEKNIQLHMDCRDSLQAKQIPINTFSTFQISADVDEIRKLLGIVKWNVYSVSYGTSVAISYMRNFEKSINQVVLDSPFPPNAKSFSFVSTMNETLNHMQTVINMDVKTAKAFPDIINDFATASERLNKKPLQMEGSVLSGDDFANIMLMTFYKTKLVPLIPLALKEFASGNDELLSKWVNSLYSKVEYGKENDFHNLAVYCYECKPRTYDQTPLALARKFPYLAALAEKDYMDICSTFRPEFPDSEFYEPIKTNLPTLVMSGEFDPGTPVSYGYNTIEKMTNAKFVIVPNASHSAATYNDCTMGMVKDFFDIPNASLNTDCVNRIEKLKFAISDLKTEMDKITGDK